ncbi:MAG: peptide-methionine (R)-S-oxide reductase MsrB [Methanomethylophilus sp.]
MTVREIYFAGGCFWGTQKLMDSVAGVTSTEVGFANGDPVLSPSYEEVCRRRTGYRETVHVTYNPVIVSLDYLVYVFFASIDPTVADRQGNDCRPQYQAGIFWTDPESETVVKRIAAVEARRYRPFQVLLEPLRVFRRAEECHQKYLNSNPHGYCHIDRDLFRQVADPAFDPSVYRRPAEQEIKQQLTPEQYAVSQEASTEPAFDNDYDAEYRRGIFVDRVTGEPLFLSSDKYNSHCGWPAFTKPLDPNAVVFREDHQLPLMRIEVRSRVGDSHLGHIFFGDKSSPNGIRYCMNSASLRFIPYEEMEKAGYGALMKLVGPKRKQWRS